MVVELNAYPVRGNDIHRLAPGQWLNDEIINFYGQLMIQRAKKNPGKYPKVHVYTTFFYSRLTNGYDKVKTWSRRVRYSKLR